MPQSFYDATRYTFSCKLPEPSEYVLKHKWNNSISLSFVICDLEDVNISSFHSLRIILMVLNTS